MAMAAFSTHHTSFMTTANPSLLQFQTRHSVRKSPILACRSSAEKENTDSSNSGSERAQLAKLAVVTLAAGMLALGSAHDAMAAKSAGRVGGQAFRSAAPKSSGPRINNSRTNIYVNPPIAPPLVGGYGYGVPYYGGWGWSPFTFFAPGPSVAVGIGGFDVFAAILLFAAVSAVIRRFRGGRDDEEDDY